MMDPKILRQTLGAEVVGCANQVVVRTIGVVVVIITVVIVVVVVIVIIIHGLIRQVLVVLIRAQ